MKLDGNKFKAIKEKALNNAEIYPWYSLPQVPLSHQELSRIQEKIRWLMANENIE